MTGDGDEKVVPQRVDSAKKEMGKKINTFLSPMSDISSDSSLGLNNELETKNEEKSYRKSDKLESSVDLPKLSELLQGGDEPEDPMLSDTRCVINRRSRSHQRSMGSYSTSKSSHMRSPDQDEHRKENYRRYPTY